MKKLLKSPVLWGVLAALVVTFPQVTAYEFFATDCTHVGVLSGRMDYPGMGPLTLYRFSDGNPQHMSAMISEGFQPWFSTLDRKMNMCRHLSSALTALNYQISGVNPVGYVLHSVLWYLVIIVLVGLLVRRIIPGSGGGTVHPVSFLTLIIFALAYRNALMIYYGGARWLLITIAFGLAGLLAHIKWREQDWKPGRFLSLIAFLLALLSGEAALAMLAYLAAYELFGTSDPVKKRINALLPTAVMALIYLIIYRLMNYGTANMTVYSNPFNDPIGFISTLPLKVAAMLGEMFLGIMSLFGIYPTAPSGVLSTYLAGIGALVLVGLLFYPVWSSAPPPQRRKFNWLMVGTAAAMLPMASVNSHPRVVLILFIGGSILLAFIVHHWAKKIRQKPKSLAWIGGVACIGLLGIHIILSTYYWFIDARFVKLWLDDWNKFQAQTVLTEIKPHQKAIFLNGTCGLDLNGSLSFTGYYYRKVKDLPMPESWWPLSFQEKNIRYHRTTENKLELEILEGSLLDHPDIQGIRNLDVPFKKGEILKFPGFQVTILEVNKVGPTRMEFAFERSLDDEIYCFYKLQEGRLHIVTPPVVGQSLTL
jgi:energy-converting hydrogenase Eha subunit E